MNAQVLQFYYRIIILVFIIAPSWNCAIYNTRQQDLRSAAP